MRRRRSQGRTRGIVVKRRSQKVGAWVSAVPRQTSSTVAFLGTETDCEVEEYARRSTQKSNTAVHPAYRCVSSKVSCFLNRSRCCANTTIVESSKISKYDTTITGTLRKRPRANSIVEMATKTTNQPAPATPQPAWTPPYSYTRTKPAR